MADSQRQRLYDAEQMVRVQLELAAKGAQRATVLNSTITIPLELRFGSLESVQSYLQQVQQTDWYRRLFPRATSLVTVRKRKGDGKAHYEGGGVIAMHDVPYGKPGWALREIVALHELAHHVARGDGHGPVFAGTFLRLVQEAMGWETALLLTSAYADHGVKWSAIPA